MNLVQRFARIVADKELIPPGAHLLVACSGGGDSLALLHLLIAVRNQFSLRLTVAHLDHALRLKSHEDAAWLSDHCNNLKIPILTERIEVRQAGAESGERGELAARTVRYAFLNRTAEQIGADLVVLGHHQDDQVETVLHRIIRGCGTTGLAGMAWRRDHYVRPLLLFSRRELEQFLRSINVRWLTDESNDDTQYTRNRIRHRVLPVLREENPSVNLALCRLADQMRSDEIYWRDLTERWLAEHLREHPFGVALSREVLVKESAALRMRIYRSLLQRFTRIEVETIHLEAVDSIVGSDKPQGEAPVPQTWAVTRYDLLIIGRRPPEIPAYRIEVNGPGRYQLFPGGELVVRWVSEEIERVEHRMVDLPFFVRNALPGDRLSERTKLKKRFSEWKLTVEERSCWPVVEAGRSVLSFEPGQPLRVGVSGGDGMVLAFRADRKVPIP